MEEALSMANDWLSKNNIEVINVQQRSSSSIEQAGNWCQIVIFHKAKE
jgi:hypothetical protein